MSGPGSSRPEATQNEEKPKRRPKNVKESKEPQEAEGSLIEYSKEHKEWTKELQHRLTTNKRLVWMPRAICISSKQPYFEFFQEILKDLLSKFHKKKDKEPLLVTSILEQHVFNIVFQIPKPLQSR